MKIIWSPLAYQRINEIAQYIAKDNVTAAERWVKSVYDKVRSLQDFPERGRVVPEVGKHYIIEILFGDYRIIYRLEERAINNFDYSPRKTTLSIEVLSDE